MVFRPALQWRSPESLIPYHRNNKNHQPAAVAKLAAHIAENGWDVPIVVDGAGVIIKGHRRRLAALEMGLTEVPVIVRSDLSEEQLAAMRIADNRLADDSPYDEAAIAEEIGWLAEAGLNLESTALDAAELDYLLNSLAEVAQTPAPGHEFEAYKARSSYLGDDDDDEEQEERPAYMGEDTDDDESPAPRSPSGGKYSLAVVIDWGDRQRWHDIRGELGERKDSPAFLKLLALAEIVRNQQPEIWRAIAHGN